MARTYTFETLDVFTNQRFGGNPLAVFPDANGLTGAEMQALAAEFNLSETAFVLPPADPAHTARVRIFTPRTELPFAGHPNVGTGWLLASKGRDQDGVLLFEEEAGLVRIEAQRDSGRLMSVRIGAPQPLVAEDGPPALLVAACAGLAPADLTGTPAIASVGIAFTMVAVTAEALTRATPDTAGFNAVVEHAEGRHGSHSLSLYVRDGDKVRTRNFAPLLGIPEDPATGSAATALVALLLHQDGGDALDLTITQGDEMGRPSRLHATARRTPDGIRAWVGGACVPVMEGRVTL